MERLFRVSHTKHAFRALLHDLLGDLKFAGRERPTRRWTWENSIIFSAMNGTRRMAEEGNAVRKRNGVGRLLERNVQTASVVSRAMRSGEVGNSTEGGFDKD